MDRQVEALLAAARALSGWPGARIAPLTETRAAGVAAAGVPTVAGPYAAWPLLDAGGGALGVLELSCHAARPLPLPGPALTALAAALAEALRSARDLADQRARAHDLDQYRQLVEQSSNVITRHERDGRLRFASPALQRILGLPAEATVGLDPLPRVHGHDRAAVRRAFTGALAGLSTRVRLRVRHAEGGWIPLEASLSGVTGPDGRVECVQGSSRDITAQQALERRAAEAGRQAEAEHAHLDAVLETVDVGVVACDATGRVTLVNRVLRTLHPYGGGHAPPSRPPDALHDALTESLPESLPDGRQAPWFTQDLPLLPALRGERVVGLPLTIAVPDGARSLICDGRQLRDASGALLGAVLVVRDVTAARQAAQELQRAHAQASSSERLMRTILDTVEVAIAACDEQGRPTYSNSTGRLLLGLAPGRAAGFGPTDAEAVARARDACDIQDAETGAPLTVDQRPLERALRDGVVRDVEIELSGWDRLPRRMLVHASALQDEQGRTTGAVAAAHDITQLRARERALAESEARFRATFTHSPLAMARLATDGRVLESNPALRRMLARSTRLLQEATLAQLCEADDRDTARTAVEQAVAQGSASTELRLRRVDRERVWCHVELAAVTEADGTTRLLAQLADVSERKQHDHELLRSARTDSLTGLANREALTERLHGWLAADSPDAPLALLFCDLDGFKSINDRLGHDAGDEVLVAVARRLQAAVRGADLAARWGGDEFVVACPRLGRQAAQELAARLRATVAEPVRTRAGQVTVGLSVGLEMAHAGQDSTRVLGSADRQMYRNKQRSRGRGPTSSALPGAASVVELAVTEGRTSLAYQPVVEVATGRPVGVEALLRVHGRDGRLLPAEQVEQVAEATGAVGQLGAWMLEQAVARTQRWKAQLPDHVPFGLGVNVSAGQFDDPAFVERVGDVLRGSRLPRGTVVLEVPETSLLGDSPAVRVGLEAFAEAGARLHVDDFGSGYTSVRYLMTLPFHGVKMDRSYVAALGAPRRSGAVAAGLFALARRSGLLVIAEGVDTASQRDRVAEQGVGVAQGSLWHPALTAKQVDALLPTIAAHVPRSAVAV